MTDPKPETTPRRKRKASAATIKIAAYSKIERMRFALTERTRKEATRRQTHAQLTSQREQLLKEAEDKFVKDYPEKRRE